jgi:hypothetical protein
MICPGLNFLTASLDRQNLRQSVKCPSGAWKIRHPCRESCSDGMTPEEYAARIRAESADGVQWEWTCPLRPKGFRSGYQHLTFGDELRKILPREFEIIQDMQTDTLIVRRVYQEEKLRFLEPPPKPKQGELF